jgi:hypothetical protein
VKPPARHTTQLQAVTSASLASVWLRSSPAALEAHLFASPVQEQLLVAPKQCRVLYGGQPGRPRRQDRLQAVAVEREPASARDRAHPRVLQQAHEQGVRT